MKISNRPADWQRTLALALEPELELPLFLQIARGISDAIRNGRLKPVDRLPGTRRLARELGVHRNTVLAAYSELAAEGWIETTPASGSFVSRALSDSELPSRRRAHDVAAVEPGFVLRNVLSPTDYAGSTPGLLVMSGGVPDTRLVPADALSRAYRRALRRRAGDLLSYGDPRGPLRLRTAIAEMLSATRALAVTEDDLLITRGSQMALDLIARTLLSPGDVVAVEAYGYPPAWQAFRLSGARLVGIPVDAHGIDVQALAALAAKTRLAAVYVTPHHQFPTLATLTAARRLALLELAARHRFAIIEDDYDHEFHYESRPVLPLMSSDRTGSVIYVGTLSKILAPGLRIGYLTGPRRFVEQAMWRRLYCDRQGDQAVEHAIAELLEDGEIQRHARRVRRIYLNRRQILIDALTRSLPTQLRFDAPAGGMALWARTARGIDVERWAARALARGVLVSPGSRFAFDGRRRPFLRLGFAALDEREIERAIRVLESAL